MAKKLRVGIAGLGRIFDLNCLGYIGHPDAEVVGLCDTDPALLEQRRKLFPDARTTTRFEEMLAWDLDLVDLLTPHPLHAQMAEAASAAGAHLTVQKPMAMTLSEADRMIAAAQKAGRHLKLFENFVFYPPLVKMRELLNDGAIGTPLHFRMKVVLGDPSQAWPVPTSSGIWRQEIAQAGHGGPMVFDHGHHMMAVALWLFGDVRDGFACIDETTMPSGRRIDAPATLTWRHVSPPVHGMWDVSVALKMQLRTDYYPDNERFEIQGESGILQVTRCSDRLLDEPVLTLYRDGEVRAWHNLDADWGGSFRRSTQHYIDFLLGRAPEIILTAQEGRRVLQLHEMFVRANREQSAVPMPA
ncbi:MAG TPA: Gfo/Idh/MocA family oxidoreductase [Acetobacteraceae bacterium]|nr:Gfo/Idh/MocA family oxidoreductase [Acetobacteraceae bacterium]